LKTAARTRLAVVAISAVEFDADKPRQRSHRNGGPQQIERYIEVNRKHSSFQDNLNTPRTAS